MFLTLKHFSLPQRGGALVLAAACFAAGLTAGALVAPVGAGIGSSLASNPAGDSGERIGVAAAAPPSMRRQPAAGGLRGGHPAEVLRVLDGDTFEARVHVWPGMEITTKVRLRGIDAPEMRARCEDERVKALAARDALVRYLNEGNVGIARIGQDKYGGRVDADVSTAKTPDVSAALLERGFARRYGGGRRESWCG